MTQILSHQLTELYPKLLEEIPKWKKTEKLTFHEFLTRSHIKFTSFKHTINLSHSSVYFK